LGFVLQHRSRSNTWTPANKNDSENNGDKTLKVSNPHKKNNRQRGRGRRGERGGRGGGGREGEPTHATLVVGA